MKQTQVRRKWMRATWLEVTLRQHVRAQFPSQLRRNQLPMRAIRLHACVLRAVVRWISWMAMAGRVVREVLAAEAVREARVVLRVARAVVPVVLAHDRHRATTP